MKKKHHCRDGIIRKYRFYTKNAQPMNFQVDAQPINIYMKIRIDLRKNLQIPRNNLNRKNQKYKIWPNNKKPIISQQQNEFKDIWSKKGKLKKRLRTNVKSIVTTHPGQQYNLQLKDYNELLDDVVKIEIRSHQRLQNQETEEEKAQQLILQRQFIKQIDQRKRKKEIKKMSKIKKFMEKKWKIMNSYQQRKNQMLKLSQDFRKGYNRERAKKLQGRNLVPIKIGNKKIDVTYYEFILDDQLKSSLRHVTQGDFLVKSEFNGFVRRGLIEPKSKSNKLSKAKVPLFKIKEK